TFIQQARCQHSAGHPSSNRSADLAGVLSVSSELPTFPIGRRSSTWVAARIPAGARLRGEDAEERLPVRRRASLASAARASDWRAWVSRRGERGRSVPFRVGPGSYSRRSRRISKSIGLNRKLFDSSAEHAVRPTIRSI